jgi:hypothetical protein
MSTTFLPSPEMLSELLARQHVGALGDLGERLREDGDASLREQYRRAFDATIEKAHVRLARPLPEPEFAATQATVDACTQASAVLDLVWAALQTTPGALRSGP